MPKFNIFTSEEDLPSHFIPAERVSIVKFLKDGGKIKQDALAKFIEMHCIQKGKPLVIGDIQKLTEWDDDLFNIENLAQIYPKEQIGLFNMKTRENSSDYQMAEYIKELNPQPAKKTLPVKSRYKAEVKTKRHETSVKRIQLSVCPGQEQRQAPIRTIGTDDDRLVPQIIANGSNEQEPRTKGWEPTRVGTPRATNRSSNKSPKGAFYAKDLSCPAEYKEKISELLPNYLLPLGSYDLFGNMPHQLRAENLMCYIGSSKTGTALHRDICGTIGHNLMSYGEEGAYAEWYFIENCHRDALLRTIHARKQRRAKASSDASDDDDLLESEQLENHKSSFVESDRAWVGRVPLKKAGFKTHVAIQRPGDLILIPSLCYHQVRNVKTSVKIAWNRATARTLQLALEDQLPIYQSLVRPEIYRCKAMVYYSLKKWRERLFKMHRRTPRSHGDSERFLADCRILLQLFAKYVLYPEMIEESLDGGFDGRESGIKADERLDDIGGDNNSNGGDGDDDEHSLFTTVCDFCCADIFSRHYRCESCDDYDLCLSCYSQGRGCEHLDQLTMYQGRKSAQYYMDFYLSVLLANEVLTFLEHPPFENDIPKDGSSYSLATTCRRIEMYRKTNGILSNFLMCGHCESITTLSELYQVHGLDPHAIFKRRRCSKLVQDPNSNIVYTCRECTSECEDGCQPFPEVTKELTEKVYYYAPRNDERNWGGPADVGVYDTSYWPDRRTNTGAAKSDRVCWTHEDIRGKVLAAIVRSLDREVLKRALGKKDTARSLVAALMKASNCWSDLMIEQLQSGIRAPVLCPPEETYEKYLQALGVAQSIKVEFPDCSLRIVANRKRKRDTTNDDHPVKDESIAKKMSIM